MAPLEAERDKIEQEASERLKEMARELDRAWIEARAMETLYQHEREQLRALRIAYNRVMNQHASLAIGYDTVIHTKSWKITAPLRAVKDLWRETKKKIRLFRMKELFGEPRPAAALRRDHYGERFSIRSFEGVPEHAGELGKKLAVHLHLYYLEMLPEFFRSLNFIPYRFDLFVSVPNEPTRAKCVEEFSKLQNVGALKVEIVVNKGRDIASLVVTFAKDIHAYDYVCHIHSKKSAYNDGTSSGWREYLLSSMFGSQQKVRQIFHLFESESRLGMVYPQTYAIVPYQAHNWLANREEGRRWCEELGLAEPPDHYFNFPAGSFFWARVEAIRPLLAGHFTFSDFSPEEGQTDGTLAHAIERLFGIAPHSLVYETVAIQDESRSRWSPWNFERYLDRRESDVAFDIRSSSIRLVIFDIFDTLLTRPLLDPSSVKRIVAERAGERLGAVYLQWREAAEERARRHVRRDVGLDEIYTMFRSLTNLSQEEADSLRSLEEHCEMASVSVRPEAVKLLDLARASGKRVVLASDTFLSRPVIEAMLREAGVGGWERMYLSCEVGERKDTTRLFAHILKVEKVSPNEALMIGDNERSDWQIPDNLGMETAHLLSPTNLALAIPRLSGVVRKIKGCGTLDEELTLGLSVRKSYDKLFYPKFSPIDMFGGTPRQVGYASTGPFVAGFCDWLARQAARDGITDLYFLSREGLILKRAYERWSLSCPGAPRAHYLVLSRRAASVAAISRPEDLDAIAAIRYYANSLSAFVSDRFGIELSPAKLDEIHRAKLWVKDKRVEVRGRQIAHLKPLLEYLYPAVQACAQKEREALMLYLGREGLTDKAVKAAVVDVGYSGTVQGRLTHLCGRPVHGYYAMTTHDTERFRAAGIIAQGGVYDGLRLDEALPALFHHSFKLEKVLSSSESQLIHYQVHGTDVRAVFRDRSDIERASDPVRAELQAGILDYIDEALRIKERLHPGFSPSLSVGTAILETFFTDMSVDEKWLLDTLAIDDLYCGRGVITWT